MKTLASIHLIHLLVRIIPTICWGQDGHEIVADIAYSRLTAKAQQKACAILSKTNEEQSCLGQIANWADEYRYTHEGKWSKPLHFVDVQDDLIPYGCHYNNTNNCTFVYERDCKHDFCVVGAIANYSSRLLNESNSWDSLKFIVHFVGDIHQPLHVSRGSDYGGNSIHVHFDEGYSFTHGNNLHSIWDSSMILRAFYEMSMDQTEYKMYLLHLLESIYRDDVNDWLECSTDVQVCPSVWAEESLHEALTSAYSNEFKKEIVDGDVITNEYYYSRIRIIEKQLLKGAVRLAALLEYILEQYDDGIVQHGSLGKLFGQVTHDARNRYLRTSK